MKTAHGILDGHPLLLHVPETKEELAKGYDALPVRSGEAMLFELADFAVVPLWIPIAVGKDAEALDVLWIEKGFVTALATIQTGMLQGYGDRVLELPAGFCLAEKVHAGAWFEVQRGN